MTNYKLTCQPVHKASKNLMIYAHKPASAHYGFYIFTQDINTNFDQNQAKDQARKPTRGLSAVVQVVVDTSINVLWASPTSYGFNSFY